MRYVVHYEVVMDVEEGNGARRREVLRAKTYAAAERLAEKHAERHRRHGRRVTYNIAKKGVLR